MKFIRAITLFILLGSIQFTWCGFIDKKTDQGVGKLQTGLDKSLDRGSTNLSIKLTGVGFIYFALSRFLIPEITNYSNKEKKYTWNRQKIIAGIAGVLVGLGLIASGDRMSNYFYGTSN